MICTKQSTSLTVDHSEMAVIGLPINKKASAVRLSSYGPDLCPYGRSRPIKNYLE
jgi:hypothetical protein